MKTDNDILFIFDFAKTREEDTFQFLRIINCTCPANVLHSPTPVRTQAIARDSPFPWLRAPISTTSKSRCFSPKLGMLLSSLACFSLKLGLACGGSQPEEHEDTQYPTGWFSLLLLLKDQERTETGDMDMNTIEERG